MDEGPRQGEGVRVGTQVGGDPVARGWPRWTRRTAVLGSLGRVGALADDHALPGVAHDVAHLREPPASVGLGLGAAFGLDQVSVHERRHGHVGRRAEGRAERIVGAALPGVVGGVVGAHPAAEEVLAVLDERGVAGLLGHEDVSGPEHVVPVERLLPRGGPALLLEVVDVVGVDVVQVSLLLGGLVQPPSSPTEVVVHASRVVQLGQVVIGPVEAHLGLQRVVVHLPGLGQELGAVGGVLGVRHAVGPDGHTIFICDVDGAHVREERGGRGQAGGDRAAEVCAVAALDGAHRGEHVDRVGVAGLAVLGAIPQLPLFLGLAHPGHQDGPARGGPPVHLEQVVGTDAHRLEEMLALV